jgi:hypothetical protein
LLLALVIGWVISTPLVLQIFQPEIEAKLTTMNAEALERSNLAQEAAYQRIGELRAELQQLRDARDHKLTPAVDDDPDVRAAKADYDNAERNYQNLQSEALAELDGTGGTRSPGVGRAYLEKETAAQLAMRERDAAMSRLEAARAQAQDRLWAAADQVAADARARLPGVESELADQEERRRAAQDEAHDAQSGNTGLLARLEALNRVTAGHPTAAMTHWMLFLLFVCIEVLPVATKLLSLLGPPSLYDRLAEHEDERADGAARIRVTCEREIAQTQAYARLTVAKQQAEAQIEAGRATSQALADQQTAIALKAVNAWGRDASQRTDEELDR